MAERPKSKSLRDYASFELERKGYDRAQVDAFLAELDQAFIELEKAVKERGQEVAAAHDEIERLQRESPIGRSEELLRRAETNAEQMLASSLEESQKIISNAEAISMRIIANARAQSQEIAAQPPGFGMLARVRTIAADIDRMKAEHAALMDDGSEQLVMPTEDLTAMIEEVAPAPDAQDKGEAAAATEADVADPSRKDAAEKKAAKEPAAKKSAAKKSAAKKPAADQEPETSAEEPDDDLGELAPRIQLIEPPPPVLDAAEDGDDEAAVDEVTVDAKNFDWSAARAEVLALEGDGDADPLTVAEDDDGVGDELPTIMRRQGSRYERHSASLPKIGNEGESTLSDISKVSRRRRRRTVARDEDPA